jgi:hypothetical protein
MKLVHSATVGVALALGAASAHAQSVISRQIGNEPVETTVTQTPNGTVITRRPLAAVPAPVAPATVSTTEVDETVGAAPATTRTRVERSTRAHRAERTTRTVTRTAHSRVAVAPRLVLDRTQRAVVYRTIVQQQVVPPVAVAPVPPAGYPPYPAPAYPQRTVVVPAETTGYGVVTPAEDVDDVTIAEAPATYPAAPYPVRYTIGARLPAGIVAAPLPVTAAVEVPAVRPYSYVTLGGRVLLIDPVTNTVVADVTP